MTGLTLVPLEDLSNAPWERRVQWQAVQRDTVTGIRPFQCYSDSPVLTRYTVSGMHYVAPVDPAGFMRLLKADWS